MISEAAILIAGLILFSGTASYDLYNKSEVAKNRILSNSTVQVEKGFFDLRIKKVKK
jgi:hypothetical protein